ncbi:pyruvate dehydrogenase E1 component beta subunit [Dongia mobilis]|uniref:Pyruvate dehydrogenase E1 component beta subunit n=1 Tax=Dongia mobilis TaxID=578943 RepID=A0A4R6WU15_9PROT|nr:alpha-ketoacid dehydrogenase subunit beta [Dongia mobilis]TDQ82390.1 pyruvate dehydrogenase E1 component beta subunit [Dongia mobilis]
MTATATILPNRTRRNLTIAKAMAEAIAQEMRRDDSVLVLGEDIAALGGVFGNTRGLLDEFGPARVRDTPISETGFIGAAVGMAAVGLRPVVELMFVDFFGVCMDAIYNLAAKNCYFSGGQSPVPLVLMTSVGGGYGDAGQHSQCLYGTFAHLPGMKVVVPSNAHDAKGLMIRAIRDDNPVIFMFHKALQGMGWLGTVQGSITDVPEDAYEIPFGQAAICRAGNDICIVSLGAGVHLALDAAQSLGEEGIAAEVVDLRTLVPLDRATIIASTAKTGRLLVVDEDYQSFGVSGEIIASVVESGVALKAPPRRIAFPDIPIPFSPALEHPALPSAAKIVATARQIVRAGR